MHVSERMPVRSTTVKYVSSQYRSSNAIPAQANLKATKARIPSATPFFCLTNENETRNTVNAITNRSRALGNERAKETAKQYRALNAANTPKILSRSES